MKRILLTGFEPFSEFKKNPSETLVRNLDEWFRKNSDYSIETLILPVEYERVESWVDGFDFSQYDFVFQFGVASGRHCIGLERVALNWMESKNPDNNGERRRGRRIQESLPEALFSELNLSQLVDELNPHLNNSIEVSFSAGGFLCNFAYFKSRMKIRNCLFIHIPSHLRWEEKEISHTEDLYSETLNKIGIEIIKKVIESF